MIFESDSLAGGVRVSNEGGLVVRQDRLRTQTALHYLEYMLPWYIPTGSMSGRLREKMANISTMIVQHHFDREDGTSAYQSTEKEIVSRSSNDVKAGSRCSAYFANSIDRSQKLRQFLIIRVE